MELLTVIVFYRRQEDPYGDSRGMRPYASEGAMNRIGVSLVTFVV